MTTQKLRVKDTNLQIIPFLLYHVSLSFIEAEIRCAVSATGIIEPVFLLETEKYTGQVSEPLTISDQEKECRF
jgi:hypothetical protein